MKLLEGKTALITGGSRGIGKGICEVFAAQGADVAFTFHSSSKAADDVVAQLVKEGITAKGYQSNAADYSAAEKLISDVIADFSKIDILVNNAGITRDNLLMRMSEDQWDDVINTNLKSVFNLSKHIARPMMKARSGSIINISSVVGVNGNAGQANYSASKAGIFGFTKSMAKELGSRNIRVNAVAPGFIETEMTAELDEKVLEQWKSVIPLKRGGSPTDVANACAFLGSDLSAYITGQTLLVDGGMVM